MKRIVALFLAALMLISTAALLSSCGKKDPEKTVMQISLNPELELVLDEKGVVVTVNALNEEGNIIASTATLVGKSAEEAAALTVSLSEEMGFIAKGETNDISISFSGNADAAKKLYKSVKGEIERTLTAENITATVKQASAISKAGLKILLAECAPEVDTSDMSYTELVDALIVARAETAEIYSQELKKVYYESKLFALEQAEVEVILEHLNTLEKAALEAANATYVGTMETLEALRKSLLIDENSPYQVALREFRAAKVEYLNYRREVAEMEEGEITATTTAQLTEYETALNTAETALVAAGEAANLQITATKATLSTAYNALIALVSLKASTYSTEIAAERIVALSEFNAAFASEYAAALEAAENDWVSMKLALTETAE